MHGECFSEPLAQGFGQEPEKAMLKLIFELAVTKLTFAVWKYHSKSQLDILYRIRPIVLEGRRTYNPRLLWHVAQLKVCASSLELSMENCWALSAKACIAIIKSDNWEEASPKMTRVFAEVVSKSPKLNSIFGKPEEWTGEVARAALERRPKSFTVSAWTAWT